MNKDQTRCAMQELAGELQRATGRLIGSRALEMRGFRRQLLGKAEKHLADARATVAVRNAARKDVVRA